MGFSFGKQPWGWAGLGREEAAAVVTEGFWHVENGCLFLTLLQAIQLSGGSVLMGFFFPFLSFFF